MLDPKVVDINIRTNLKKFFKEQIMLGNDRLAEGVEKKNCLLILDERTTKIIDKFMTVIELIECGIIGIENLHKKRKKFSNFHAIYFIEPSDESIRLMMNDFAEENPDAKPTEQVDPSLKPPLYDFAHIVFTSFVSDFQLQTLTKSKNLIYALLSVRQVNLDIVAVDENTFSLEYANEEKVMNSVINEKMDKIIEDLANRALSILTLIQKVENVQLVYQKEGAAESFSIEFMKRVQNMIDKIYEDKKEKKEYAPVYFLILNRGFDLLSPFVRDMSYQSMFFNLNKTNEHAIEFELEIEGKGVIQQKAILNEQDNIWSNYKHKPFFESMKNVSENYQNFVKKNSTLTSKQRVGKTVNDLADEIRALPQYQEFVKDYSKHLNNMLKITQNAKDSNFKIVFDYEQGLAVGKKKTMDEFDEKDLKKALITDPDDKIRLSLIGHYARGWDMEKVGKVMLEDNESRMRYKSLTTIFDKGQTKETYEMAYDEDSPVNNPQYFKCPIGQILSKLTTQKLFAGGSGSAPGMPKFRKFDLYPKGSQSKIFERNNFKQTGTFVDKEISPIVVVFVIGGLSYNEVIQMNEVCDSKNFGEFKLISGSTGVYSPYSFVKKYTDLGNERKEKAKREREEKRRLKEEAELAEKNKAQNAMFDVLKPKKVEEEAKEDD